MVRMIAFTNPTQIIKNMLISCYNSHIGVDSDVFLYSWYMQTSLSARISPHLLSRSRETDRNEKAVHIIIIHVLLNQLYYLHVYRLIKGVLWRKVK